MLERISGARGGRVLFSEVSLRLAPGQAVLISGANGIGKSSLLRMIAGLLPLHAGRIDRAGALALVDESNPLDPRRPLAQALQFWAALDGGDAARVANGLAAMAIEHLAPVPVRMLSTGQRKRGLLAGLIAGDAPIWLLDEPGNGLDSASLARLEAVIADHRARGGIVVLTSHQRLALPDAQHIRLGAA